MDLVRRVFKRRMKVFDLVRCKNEKKKSLLIPNASKISLYSELSFQYHIPIYIKINILFRTLTFPI